MKYIALILGIFGLELHIKNEIEENKTEKTEEEKCGGAILIRKHHNRGAFLNAGQARQKAVAVISVFFTAFITIFFLSTLGTAGRRTLKWGLSLLLGGAYSNTYDRLKRKYVVDYVSFNITSGPLKRLRRVIFNIGDFCIMAGALLCVIGYGK